MSKELVDKYIRNKQIPLSFVINNKRCRLLCNTETHWLNGYNYPEWFGENSNYNRLNYFTTGHLQNAFISEKETMEECITDFLWWFELNKSRCKSVRYYKKYWLF